jgi:purine-nucleoside phosphorylase
MLSFLRRQESLNKVYLHNVIRGFLVKPGMTLIGTGGAINDIDITIRSVVIPAKAGIH